MLKFLKFKLSSKLATQIALALILGAIATFSLINSIAQAQPQHNCARSYPDFCIPSPPPDLNCSDIAQKNFKVLPPDPHKLDRDKDGIGCESKSWTNSQLEVIP